MRVSDSYNRTNDIRTFYAIRGIAIEEEAIVVYFYPVTTDSTLSTNSLSVGFDHTLSPRSTLNFSAGHSFSYYPEVEGAPAGLSGLKNISGSASYTRRLNDRTSMSVGYNGSYYSFDKFSSAVSTAVIVGLSSLVAKNTTVSISAGPSRVNNLGPLSASNTNLAASLSISKTIKENSFHASISNNNATASGVGTLSNTRSLTAGVSRNFGRRVSAFADFSAFDGTGIVGNPYRTRGTSATANMGYSLARNLSARAGISFQRYTQPSPYAYTQRQIFAGLHYSHPNLLRSH
jgi:hypothetical protein